MSIPHLDDLEPDNFLYIVQNTDLCSIQEKIDGNYLEFGIDDEGFYTSRISKGNPTKYRKPEDYGSGVWAESFKSAHKFLQEALKNEPKGFHIPCEILYGSQPNTVPYKLDRNKIVLFDLCSPLVKRLMTKRGTVDIVTFTSPDGEKFDKHRERQEWEIINVPRESFGTPKLTNSIEHYTHYLSNSSGIKNLSNRDVLKIKLNKIPNSTAFTRQEFRDLKPFIKEKREKIREEARQFQQEIKGEILEYLFQNKKSHIDPGLEFFEGFVLHEPLKGDIKLVDKRSFTAANKFNHFFKKDVQTNVWLPFKREVTANPEKSNRIAEKYQTELRKRLEEYKNKWKGRFIELDNGVQIYYNRAMHQRNLDFFADSKNRILETSKEKFLEAKLKDKQKTFGNISSKVEKGEVFAIVKELSNILNISNDELSQNLLGSAGRKETSGDIDVAISEEKFSPGHIKNTLEPIVGSGNIKYSAGLNIIHALYPYKNKRVQVDFIFTENPKWTRFAYYSPGDKSKYKGAYRARLLAAIAASTNEVKYSGEEPVFRKGWIWVPSKGLQWQIKQRTKKADGNYTKSFKTIEKGESITNPKQVAKTLFGEDVSPNDLKSVESIYEIMYQKFRSERITTVKRIFKQGLKDSKLDIPRELF